MMLTGHYNQCKGLLCLWFGIGNVSTMLSYSYLSGTMSVGQEMIVIDDTSLDMNLERLFLAVQQILDVHGRTRLGRSTSGSGSLSSIIDARRQTIQRCRICIDDSMFAVGEWMRFKTFREAESRYRRSKWLQRTLVTKVGISIDFRNFLILL